MSSPTSTGVAQLDLQAVRRAISGTFSLDDLKVACFDLGIVYDNLPGGTQDVKVIELIEYAKRHGMLQGLVAYVQKERPHLKLSNNAQTVAPAGATADERSKHRRALRDEHRDIYLVHTLRPSSERSGWYDILIYLIAHRDARLSEVSYAEFFLGGAWNNRIFKADNQDGFVGITVSAYGPFLCTSRVVFQDNHAVLLERYVDFEMAGALTRGSKRGGRS
ncbi:MAG: hypothetical protein M1546_09180 [Chloroflexi bacterium]|nr:hypothetical protein [Chloroflexota bacterium]